MISGWIATPQYGPDHRGPIGRAFTAFPDQAMGQPIIDHLERVVATRPGLVAVDDPAGSLNFADLWTRASALAPRLAAAPPGPVGILLPPGAPYVVGLFAALAAGRMALLLDPTHPADRNATIAADAGAGFLLTDTDAAPAGTGRCQVLGPDDPALILCTSGSTGRPKAIVHSQRTMLHWVRSITNALHVTPEDRVLSISSPASLGGLTALLTFPLAGASVQMPGAAGFGALLDTLTQRPVTVLRAGPSLLRTLVQLPGAGDALRRLRVVQTYGEPLMKADLAMLRPHLAPGCLIRSTYGATEASGFAWFAGNPDDHDPVRVATGTLMPDTEAQLLGDDGQPTAPGTPGELVIRSRYNALGEWQAGALVPGRLEADSLDPAVRVYRTGDLARCSRDGVFVVLGRKDRMVNINGQRAEPAEVEAALRRHPDVRQAAIVTRQVGTSARLLAFVVARDGAPSCLVDTLRTVLRGSLPAFLQPSRITVLDALPLLPGGKLDEAALLQGIGEPG